MKYALDRFEEEVRAAIVATGKLPADQIELTTPKPTIPADLAFSARRRSRALRRQRWRKRSRQRSTSRKRRWWSARRRSALS
jgi:hypothetical protein